MWAANVNNTRANNQQNQKKKDGGLLAPTPERTLMHVSYPARYTQAPTPAPTNYCCHHTSTNASANSTDFSS